MNKLTNAQNERLALLMEECGEVIHIIGKIQRHGMDSFNPYDPNETPNKKRLAAEIADLTISLALIVHSGDIDEDDIESIAEITIKNLRKFLHCEENLSILEEVV